MSTWDEIKIWIWATLATLLIFALVAGAVCGLMAVISKNTCNQLIAVNTSYQFRWGFWSGCLVQTPSGYWVNVDKYLPIEINQGR